MNLIKNNSDFAQQFPSSRPEGKKISISRNQTSFHFFPKNKRGDKILSVYWFVILLIVAGGIFAMVYVFYGSPYDVRGIEAREMTNQIADCISYGGKINLNLISNGKILGNENFLQQCHLNFSTTEWEQEQFFSEVSFYRYENLNTPILDLKKGNANWLASCAIQETKPEENLATCLTRSFYSVDDANNQYIIKILSVVRKTEKNVKV